MLSSEQKKIYRKIIKKNSYLYNGDNSCLLLSIVYYQMAKEKYSICTSIVIFYVVQLLYYKMTSKHPLMLYYLDTVNRWINGRISIFI